MTMKVCQIISGDLWAGAEVMAYNLLKGLRKRPELDISAFTLNYGKLTDQIQKLDIPVRVIDESRGSFPQILLALREALRRNPPDIIHSHRYKENILACLASRGMERIRLIGTQHGMPEAPGNGGYYKYRMASKLNFLLLSYYFHKTVVVSKDIRSSFIKQRVLGENRIEMIHNGIEIPDDHCRIAGGGPLVIGSAGRLFPVKDYPLMVEIAKHVRQGAADKVRFELAGEGPERPKIMEMIQRYGLEKTFILRGFIKDIHNFYDGLDLYISTSIHEGIPMSILEAMARRLPIVAPGVGGFGEIVQDGVEGYLVAGRDPREMAERCLRLINDESLRKRMASAARERVVSEFSLERMARQYHQLYAGLSG
jgi:glycosyltransferase involved in cell wall biosynthesis